MDDKGDDYDGLECIEDNLMEECELTTTWLTCTDLFLLHTWVIDPDDCWARIKQVQALNDDTMTNSQILFDGYSLVE